MVSNVIKGRKNKILCITDQEELRDLVYESFSHAFNLVEADSGEKGIEVAIKEKPDVVLMDLGMHHLSGLDAAREIKHKLPEAKIIMFTLYLCDSSPVGL